MAVVDYFLKIDGIPGESHDAKHKGEHDISSFSWGMTNPTTIGSATGGAGAGKVRFNEFTINKTSDSASPVFFKNCAAGSHYKKIVLTVRKAGDDKGNSEFLKATFSDVLVSSYRESGTQPRPPEPPVDVIGAPGDTVGGPIGGAAGNLPVDGSPIDRVAFTYQKVQESIDATQIGIPPRAIGILAFDPATNSFKISDAPGAVFTVGSVSGIVSRAAMEFDNIAILIGLLTAPFSTATLTLGIQEVREAAINPGQVNAAAVNTASVNTVSDNNSNNDGPQPHLFDVILYTPADGVLTVEDLTRPGKRIGTLTVDPNAPPTSLDIELGNLVTHQHLDAFGIRIQLRGARLPDLNEDKNDEQDDSDVSKVNSSNDNNANDNGSRNNASNDNGAQADGGPDGNNNQNDDKKRTPAADFSASFTANLVFTTA